MVCCLRLPSPSEVPPTHPAHNALQPTSHTGARPRPHTHECTHAHARTHNTHTHTSTHMHTCTHLALLLLLELEHGVPRESLEGPHRTATIQLSVRALQHTHTQGGGRGGQSLAYQPHNTCPPHTQIIGGRGAGADSTRSTAQAAQTAQHMLRLSRECGAEFTVGCLPVVPACGVWM